MQLNVMKDRIMKVSTRSLADRTQAFCVVMVALVSLAMVLPSHGQITTLSSGASIARIDPYSQAGLFDWTVSGTDQLKKQWFWYRVGTAGSEFSIDTISAPTISGVSANGATITYANSSFSIDVIYGLTGNADSAGLTETIRIINKNTDPLSAPLDFHFFEYTDYDLAGIPGGQSVMVYGTAARAVQTGLLGAMGLETATPNASHREANLYDATLVKLNDALPTTLNDVLTAGPGDVTFAFEWDYAIEAGGSRLISKIKTVPEPSAMVLMALGLVAFTLRRARD
jgi:hypothetical protein